MSEERNTEYKMNARERVENFWYHYKWHTLISLFFIIVVTICTVQLCQRNSYDVYVMYAGSGELKRMSEVGDFPEHQKATSALEKYAADYDGDGKTSVSLLPLFVTTDEEIQDIQSAGKEVNYALIQDNSRVLSNNMLHSTYYVCVLSEEIFLQYCEQEGEVFDKISSYCASGVSYDFVNEYGIKLSSLNLYQRDGIKNLPSDTVVCIRRLGDVSTRFDKASQAEHERAGKFLSEILK